MAACRVVQEHVVENAPGHDVRLVLLRNYHGQAHSQQRPLAQHDMLPQHPVNRKELFCECFWNDFGREQRGSLRMILGSEHVVAHYSH